MTKAVIVLVLVFLNQSMEVRSFPDGFNCETALSMAFKKEDVMLAKCLPLDVRLTTRERELFFMHYYPTPLPPAPPFPREE
jgi:hypothetical protein